MTEYLLTVSVRKLQPWAAGYPSGYLPHSDDRKRVADAIREHASLMPTEAQPVWLKVADIFEEPDPSELTGEALPE